MDVWLEEQSRGEEEEGKTRNGASESGPGCVRGESRCSAGAGAAAAAARVQCGAVQVPGAPSVRVLGVGAVWRFWEGYQQHLRHCRP